MKPASLLLFLLLCFTAQAILPPNAVNPRNNNNILPHLSIITQDDSGDSDFELAASEQARELFSDSDIYYSSDEELDPAIHQVRFSHVFQPSSQMYTIPIVSFVEAGEYAIYGIVWMQTARRCLIVHPQWPQKPNVLQLEKNMSGGYSMVKIRKYALCMY